MTIEVNDDHHQAGLMTAEEFLRMDSAPGKRYELIRGIPTEKKTGTGEPNSVTVARSGGLLFQYTEAVDFGEIRSGEPGYRLQIDPDTVLCPDVAWFAPGQVPQGTIGFPDLTPDLCIEVESPSNARSDRRLSDKAQIWLDFGAREVWVLNPDTVPVTRYLPDTAPEVLQEGDNLVGGDLLPGFSVGVWQLFRRRR